MTRSLQWPSAALLLAAAAVGVLLILSTPKTASAADFLSLSPQNSSGATGSAFVLTATLSPASSGVLMRFEVASGPNLGDAAAVNTNFAGQASFTYVGDGGAGTDAILVFGDLNRDGQLSLGEPVASTVRLWTGASPSAITVAPTHDVNPIGTVHTVTATVSPAVAGTLVGFRVTAGPNSGQRADIATNASGQATFTYAGTGGAGVDTILAYADRNANLVLDATEPATTATKQWTGASPVTSISLAPASATNPVRTSHTLTATVSPVQTGMLVRFRVISGPNANAQGTDATNSSGRATFTYTGGGTSGTDIILAFADANSNGQIDSGEPVDIASKAWTATTVVTSVRVTPATATNPVRTNHRLTATVTPTVSGARVGFEVIAGPNRGLTRFDDTNSSGVAIADYRGGSNAGLDVIVVWADLDRDGRRDTNEPATTATKTWTSAPVSVSSVVDQARAACSTLTRFDHPALPVLCSVLDRVPSTAQPTIARVILDRDLFRLDRDKVKDGRDRHDDDDDDDDDDDKRGRRRGHDHDDDDDD
jgi:hypothetical protein